MLSIIPTNSLFAGDGIVRWATRCLTIAAALRRPKRRCRRGAPCRVFWREGEAVWVLPVWLGSKRGTGLALKPPVAGADGGERLDGEMGQHQLSSHRDDEVQVTEMHVCAQNLADCMVSHLRPDLECAKALT